MLKNIKILPSYLIKRYRVWKATGFEENKSWYNKIDDTSYSIDTYIIILKVKIRRPVIVTILSGVIEKDVIP